MDDMYNERQNHHATQGKLVLSAPPEGTGQSQSVSDQTSFMPSGNLQSSFMPGGAPPFATGGLGYPPPVQPKKNIFQKLRSDPAYQVLAVAIVVVLIASSALVAFAATGMGSTNPNNHANQQITKAQTPASRPKQVPTLPVPTQAPTPTMAPPAPVQQQPTQPPQKPVMNLTAQFTNVPQQLANGMQGQATVQTLPGATVTFEVTYAGVAASAPVIQRQMADNNGMVTFTWTVQVVPAAFGNNNNITANLAAIAVDNNTGQQAQAPQQTVPVMVNNNGGR